MIDLTIMKMYFIIPSCIRLIPMYHIDDMDAEDWLCITKGILVWQLLARQQTYLKTFDML